MADAIAVLEAQGAVIVDPADIPSVIEPDPAKSIIDWNFCGGADEVRGKDSGCTIVVKYGTRVPPVAGSVPTGIRYRVDQMVGLPVAAVGVHAQDLRVSSVD